MDINCNNFEEHFELMKHSIMSCEFICLDSEFTGAKVVLEDKAHEFDTFQDKYRKSSKAIKRFMMT